MAYRLGARDPLIHTKPGLLTIDHGEDYDRWIRDLDKKIRDSREEYIMHHRSHRDSVVPIWVAVGVLDWGSLSHLYNCAPIAVRDEVADCFGISAAQVKTWLRALNVVRNVCAHHGRFFNRYYALTPKLPRRGWNDSLDAIGPVKDTTFAMLTLLQHLSSHTRGASVSILPATLRSFPTSSGLTVGALGVLPAWEELALWRKQLT